MWRGDAANRMIIFLKFYKLLCLCCLDIVCVTIMMMIILLLLWCCGAPAAVAANTGNISIYFNVRMHTRLGGSKVSVFGII